MKDVVLVFWYNFELNEHLFLVFFVANFEHVFASWALLHRNHSILKVKQQNYKKVLAWMKVINIKHQNDASWRSPGAFIANFELR